MWRRRRDRGTRGSALPPPLPQCRREATRVDGLRITTIERTLFDVAGDRRSPSGRLAHEAIAKRQTTQAELKAAAEGTARARRAGDPAAASRAPHPQAAIERRFLRFLAAGALPHRKPTTDRPYAVDFFCAHADLVIETDEDGHKSEWPSSRTARATATSRAAAYGHAGDGAQPGGRIVLSWEEVRRAARIVR